MCDLAEMLFLLFLQAALFPQVVAAIQNAIAALGGAVIPKLNWSCPKVLCCSEPYTLHRFLSILQVLCMSFCRMQLGLQPATASNAQTQMRCCCCSSLLIEWLMMFAMHLTRASPDLSRKCPMFWCSKPTMTSGQRGSSGVLSGAMTL